ncbi:hypothetical protein, partial [Georgenia sp.]
MTSLLLLATTPAPDPVEMEIWEVTPGIEGFVWGFFLLAVIAIPLFFSMTKHMRRVDHNERLRQRAEAEATATGEVHATATGETDAMRPDAEVNAADPRVAQSRVVQSRVVHPPVEA